MSDLETSIKAGEPECLSGHEQWGTWRISLGVEPDAEWRRRFLRVALAKDILEAAGHAVIHTTDPLEALRWARKSTADMDLLLVDAVMPAMGGRELARHILGLRPTLKVILMSGYEVEDIQDSGWPFLQKPFAMKTLKETVVSELRRRPPQWRR